MTTLEQMHDEVQDCLDRIRACFKPGVKVTAIVRTVGDDEGRRDFMMGDDEPQEVMNLIARRMAAAR